MSSLWQRVMAIFDSSRSTESDGSRNGRFMVVGLGNPGREHSANRHNIGFMTVDRFAEKQGIDLSRVQQRAITGSGRIGEQAVIFAKPQTYMNRSGEAVGGLARFYKLEPQQILVVYDELDLPFGSLRLRKQGGSGGHNGMKSVIQHIGNDFPRLRLGIGRPPGRMEPADYVLQDFKKPELPILAMLLDDACAAIESFISDGVELAMTWHNKS